MVGLGADGKQEEVSLDFACGERKPRVDWKSSFNAIAFYLDIGGEP